MELILFTDLIDALGTMAGGLKAIVNLPKAQAGVQAVRLERVARMTEHKLFYYASFTNAQLPLLKVAALYFDKLFLLDPDSVGRGADQQTLELMTFGMPCI